MALLPGLLLSGPAVRGQSQPESDTSWVHESKSLAERLQTNVWRLQQSREADKQVLRQLDSIAQPQEGALNSLMGENKALRLRLLEREKELAELNGTNSPVSAPIADLQKQLAAAEEQRDLLVKKQSDLEPALGSTNATKGLRRELLLSDLEPITVKLVKNRVVPMMEPFDSRRRSKLKVALSGETVDGLVISRVHDGESASNAVRPGGLLDTLLSKSDPRKKYFRLLVCADSISAFQNVPQAIAKRGFAYSWDTSNDEDVLRPLRKQAESNPNDWGYLPPK